jgi:hypothetical protein
LVFLVLSSGNIIKAIGHDHEIGDGSAFVGREAHHFLGDLLSVGFHFEFGIEEFGPE